MKKEGESEGVFRMITSNQNIINHIITEDVDRPIKKSTGKGIYVHTYNFIYCRYCLVKEISASIHESVLNSMVSSAQSPTLIFSPILRLFIIRRHNPP